MTAAIRVQHVSKKFRRGEALDSLRDLLGSRLLRRSKPQKAGATRAEFWAVNGVTFDVAPGEAFGIIGPNGAGKSTLLKLLAGIMPPDNGNIAVAGRVSALIELGAGFHGDLTGRENIYLNASILGMSRRDVTARFDEIVEFAGIAEFLDTPVKRYSSGMHARLGFAVAVHVEPQVLLVDEVLSVGDRVFRARCMDKMREFLNRGVAVVFVSHDLASVQRFCDRAMVLSQGMPSFIGPVVQAIGHYWEASSTAVLSPASESAAATRVCGIRATNVNNPVCAQFEPGDAMRFEFDVEFSQEMLRPSYGITLMRLDDHQVVFETSSTRMNVAAPPVLAGERHHVSYDIRLNVLPGLYAMGLHVRERDQLVYAVQDMEALRIMVEAEPVAGGIVHLAPKVSVTCDSKPLANCHVRPLVAGAV